MSKNMFIFVSMSHAPQIWPITWTNATLFVEYYVLDWDYIMHAYFICIYNVLIMCSVY